PRAHSPGVAGAQGAVRDAAALRRVALGAYLPTVALNSSAGWSDQSLATAGVTSLAQPSTVNAYGAGLAAAIDVFTGGRRGAQRSQADAISQAADAGLVQQRYATVLVAKQGYFDVLRAHELVRVATEFVAQAELALGYTRDRLAAGTATRADVLLAELSLSTAHRQELADRDTLSTTSAALGRLVGANGSVDADPPATLEPVPPFNGFVREASVTQAKVTADVATATSADTKRFARAEAQRLLGSLHVAEQDITLTLDAVRLAGEDLRVIQARYRAGIATILD